MKKSLIVIGLILTAFSVTLTAQTEEDLRDEFAFGVKAGLNYSNVWDEQGQDFRADSKFGFAGGVFFGIPLGTLIGIQPELLISQKGFKGSGTLLGTPYSFTRTATYLDIPLQLQIKPTTFLTFLAGPQFSYLLKQKNVYMFGTNNVEQEQEFDNDNIRRNILGFTVGADVNVSQFVFSGRFALDFQANNGDGTSSTPRYKNQWIQLTAGYKF